MAPGGSQRCPNQSADMFRGVSHDPDGGQRCWHLTVKVLPQNSNLAPTKFCTPVLHPQLYKSPPYPISHPLDLNLEQLDEINNKIHPISHPLLDFKSRVTEPNQSVKIAVQNPSNADSKRR